MGRSGSAALLGSPLSPRRRRQLEGPAAGAVEPAARYGLSPRIVGSDSRLGCANQVWGEEAGGQQSAACVQRRGLTWAQGGGGDTEGKSDETRSNGAESLQGGGLRRSLGPHPPQEVACWIGVNDACPSAPASCFHFYVPSTALTLPRHCSPANGHLVVHCPGTWRFHFVHRGLQL